MFLSTGFPPLAFEKCLQSGDAHSRPTGPAGADLYGVNIPHAGLNVLSVRVIRLVHEYRVRVVVDSDIDRPPGCQLNARRRSAASGKAVDYKLVHYCDLICTALSRTSLSMTRPGSR